MGGTADLDAEMHHSRAGAQQPAAPLHSLIAISAAAALAVFLQRPHPALPDVGWLVVVAQRMLGGARLYSDIVEVNPPASVLLYVPIALAKLLTGAALVPLVLGWMFALSFLSIALTTKILGRAEKGAETGPWPAAAAFMTLAFPLGAFGQREHMALVALLPFLAIVVARAQGARLPPAPALLAGLCGGLAMIVKPHFVLCGLLAVLYCCIWTRSLKVLFVPENWVAAAVVVGYAVLVLVAYPDFVHVWVPILQDTYRPDRIPLARCLGAPGSIAFLLICAGAVLLLGRRILTPRPAVFLLAALGFYVAALEQGKMWPNHLYPALALASLVAVAEGFEALRGKRLAADRRLPVLAGCCVAAAGIAFAGQTLASRAATTMQLAPTIRALGPELPRLFVLSGAVAAGNPLTAAVDGVWVGRSSGQWLYQFSDHRLSDRRLDDATRRRLASYKEQDRAWARQDLVDGEPDFVLIDEATFDWKGWAMEDPAMRKALARYQRVDEAAGVALWARRSQASGGNAESAETRQ